MIHPKITLNLCGSLLVLENPVVMAVINITSDSFYEIASDSFAYNYLKVVFISMD